MEIKEQQLRLFNKYLNKKYSELSADDIDSFIGILNKAGFYQYHFENMVKFIKPIAVDAFAEKHNLYEDATKHQILTSNYYYNDTHTKN